MYELEMAKKIRELEKEIRYLKTLEKGTGGGGAFVDLTSDQSIAGVKTFAAFLVTPESAPTSDYQVANKKYVNDSVGALGTWQSYTPTTYGFSGTPYSAGNYLVIGNIMFFHVVAEGTSNSGSTYVYLPSGFMAGSSISGRDQMGTCLGMNNGTALTTPARWAIANGATYLRFHRDAAGTSWTGSGSKQVMAMGFIYVVPE